LRAKFTEVDSSPLKYAPLPAERQGWPLLPFSLNTHAVIPLDTSNMRPLGLHGNKRLGQGGGCGDCVRVHWFTMSKQLGNGPAAIRLVGHNPPLMMATALREEVPAL